MVTKKRLTYALILIWVALIVASYLLSTRIEGPRNLDTGFRRLDVLARYQFFAFGVAILAAITGFFGRKEGKRVMLIGFAPLLITGLLVGALVVAVIFGDRILDYGPQTSPGPPAATVAQPAPAQEAQD